MDKTKLFKETVLYVGIDVHKKSWSVTILTEKVHHRTFSQAPDPEALQNYIGNHFQGATVHCAYEAGRFGFWIARQLQGYGYSCLVVNPADIPSTHQETQNKRDAVDSLKIAKTLRAGQLKGSYIPSEQMEGDRQLFRYRKRLWSDLVRVKNRIKGTLAFCGVALPTAHDNAYWNQAFLKWLSEVPLPSTSTRQVLDLLLEHYHGIYAHFLETSKKVRRLLKTVRYKANGELLRTIPGIGPLTAIQLLSEVGDVNRFPSFRHFNSFIGLKPATYSSGDHDWKGHMTNRKHNGLRSALVESAWQTIRLDPTLLATYETLTKRMSGKRAIVKVARKLLLRIYHVWKSQEAYELGKP